MKVELQIILGLFLFSSITYAQKLDRKYWDNIKNTNIKAHQLSYSNLDSARTINDSLLKYVKQPYDTLILSDLYSVRANIYFNKGDFEQSLQWNLKLLKLRELIDNRLKIAVAEVKIANIYYYINSLDKAVEYLKRSIINYKKSNASAHKFASATNTLGLVYFEMNQTDSSLKYFQQALDSISINSTNNLYVYADIHGNLGNLFSSLKKYNLAIEWYQKAVAINKKINDLSGLAWNLNGLGLAFLNKKDMQLAIQNLYEADSIAQYASTFELKKDIKYSLFNYYLVLSNTDSTIKYISEYTSFNDSIINSKTKENIQEMEVKYQIKKKEVALALSEEQSARLYAENKTNKLYLSIAFIGIIGLVFFFFFTIQNSRQKRQITEMKLEMKDIEMKGIMANQESESFAAMLKGQEEERERIAQDLHDRLGGTLAALKHSLRRPENKVDQEDLSIIDEAVVEVRDIAHNLSSGLLEKQGLNVALEQLKTTIERSGEIIFHLYLHSSMAELGQEVALELFRIVQELTNNTLKHANASEISLQTSMNDQTFNLIYEDNGVGFDQNNVNGGIGLHNLKARVKKINGTLHIDSGDGRGTITIIELDLKT